MTQFLINKRDVRYKLYLPSETHQRHNENNTIYYQRTLKQLQRRQVPNLSSAASFPVRMESVDVSIVNYFISISSSAAWQDIIKCAAWSNQSVPKADIRVKLQLQCKLGYCEVFYKSCEVTSRANELFRPKVVYDWFYEFICQSWRRLIETNWSRVV